MAVLSNKLHRETLVLTQLYFPGRNSALSRVPGKECPKPEPSAALKIAECLGVRPAEVVYLGDTNTDMQTAAAAGMFAVGALWGFRDAEELRSTGAKVLIEKPLDLLSQFGD